MSALDGKKFTDPLKHLMSIDLGRTSPLENESSAEDEIPKLPKTKRVRFSDKILDMPCKNLTPTKCKGILKKLVIAPVDSTDQKVEPEHTGDLKVDDESERKSSEPVDDMNNAKVEDSSILEVPVKITKPAARSTMRCKKRSSVQSAKELETYRSRIAKEIDADLKYINCAMDIKEHTFKVWMKLKDSEPKVEEDDSTTAVSTESKKTVEKNMSDAFTEWKEKKDELAKKRRTNEVSSAVNIEASNTKNSENQEVYASWKFKKELDIRKHKKRACQIEEENRILSIQTKEIQKQEAACAFHAWNKSKVETRSARKLMDLTKAKTSKNEDVMVKIKTEMSENAYNQWLKKKTGPKTRKKRCQRRSPWNPPG